jgi:hypothetical protein
MVTFISFIVAALILVSLFGAGWFFGLRTRSRQQAAKLHKPGEDTKRSAVIAEYDDNMEIPAALIGARCKEIIETFAPSVGLTPVNVLRAAIAQGLTGGQPVLKEHLEILDEIRREEAEEMRLGPKRDPSKPS